MTITIPPDVAAQLADHATRLGTTPELLASACVSRAYPPPPPPLFDPNEPAAPKNLLEFLGKYVGCVSSRDEMSDQDSIPMFADTPAADNLIRP